MLILKTSLIKGKIMFFKKFTKFQMILMLIVILSTNLLAQDNIDKNPNEMDKSSQTKRALTKASPLITDSSIIFLHHSTGRNVYNIGNVEEWFDDYNTNNNTNFSITERDYPATPYPHDNYPYDYWNLWVTENEDGTSRIPACDSENPNIECLDSLTSNYDVIIFKQCYPGAAIGADTGSPNIASSSKRIENYKLQYRALRREMDKYPDNTFIVWTLVPLHRLATDPNQALRAKEFVDWVKNDFLTEDDQDHSNIHIFDFWGIVAEDQENPPNGQVNTLKYEYEGSHTGSDSHPNNLASQTAGPIFSQFIVDTILNAGTNLRLSNGLPNGVLPSGTTETLLSVNTNIDSVCRYSDSPLTYTEMTNTFANTNASNHSTPITGLEDEQSYEFYIKCMDADNNTNTNNYTIDFYVNSSNPALEIDIRISNFIDDAEEILSSGSVGLASSDLELVFDAEPMAVGLRFNDVEIPKNALITNAYIQFTVDEDNSEDTSLIINGHASDNAPEFTTIDFGITTREKTTATVQWFNVPPWNGKGTISPDQRTPDLKSIVQEIVNNDNWSIHNSMAFIFTGSGKRVAISFDQNPGKAPLLHVEFKTDQTQTNDNRLTERFGGSASTLDHQDVMKDTWFSIYSPSSGEVLYHDYGKPYDVAEGMARRNAVYIDVSSIPQGTHIFKARFVIQIEPDYPLSYNSYADGLSLYKITDPSGTGLWVEDDLNVSYKNRTLQLPWTDQGGSFADVIDPNPIDTVYGTMQKKSFYFFDVTDLVQTWVNHPQENVGVTFDGTIPSDEKENPELRPYLEITYEAINTDRPSQPSNFNVFHRSGQNFMTWTEIDYDGYFYNMYYRIYRHTSPINNENLNDAELVGKVHQLSSYNAGRTEARKRADSSYTTQHNYIINEGEDELSDDTGLFVYNVPQEGNYYYAVTSVVEGNENRTDFSEENSLNAPITDAPGFPEAILQGSTTHNGTIVQEFVHFTTASMNYRKGHGFNFMMNVSGSYSSENPTFLEVGLGGRSTRYYGTDSSNGGIYIQPDTYMPPTENAPWDGYEYDPLQTWWSGCSNTYKTQKGIKNGVFVPYTENRILYYIEFAKTKYNIDENRIYLRGGSMGGTGTMSLGLKHPEVFASLSATVGCPNWKYNIDAVDENYVVIDEGWRLNGNALWGTLEDNLLHENGTPIWDWMNAGWYAMNNIEKEMPFIEMNNGKKDDSVRHYAIPQFYEDMKNSKHGFAARFYDGGHSGYGSIFTPRFATFVKNESFPALRNVSIDDNVGAIHEPTGIAIVTDFESALQIFDGDIEGTINGYYDIEWSRKLKEFDNVSDVDDMIDLNDRYEIALRLEGISDHNTATMDITPRRLQHFDVTPGQTYYWENKQLSTGNIVQSGTIIADEYGLITVPGFSIEKSTWGNKLIITADQGHQEGYLHTVNVSQ
jgi:hypothetical protein